MRLRYVFAGVLGLVCAGVLVVAARVALLPEGGAQAQGPVPEMAKVYVARAEIPFGSVLTPEMVSRQSWPREAVPHLAVTDPAMLFSDEEGGRVAKGHFVEGEVLIASKLSAFGESVLAAPPADPARRAMAIRVAGEAMQAGLIGPGDVIDLVLAEGQGRDMRAVMLRTGLRVLGVGQTGLMTVEVSPADGQALALAQQAGVLVAVLHLSGPPGAAPQAIALRALTGAQVGEPSQAAPAEGMVSGVVVRRGGETSIEPVPRSAGQ